MECENDREIKLMEHAIKVLDTVVDEILWDIVEIGGMQFGFMNGEGTTDAIWIVRQIQDDMLERNNNLYCAFVDLRKHLTEYREKCFVGA